MTTAKKTNVIVMYGGKSTEHEISCRSAVHIFNNLDTKKFNIFPIGITKSGEWIYQDIAKLKSAIEQTVPIKKENALSTKFEFSQNFSPRDIFLKPFGLENEAANTVVWPMLHGTNGEDGRLQGLLELADLAFVGCSALGSAMGMDKCISKRLVQHIGINVVPWVESNYELFNQNPQKLYNDVELAFGYPAYVKPANLGSSVGITKAKNRKELEAAVALAFKFDNKILIEKGLSVREIECAALGGDLPKITTPGEIAAPEDSFYTYEAKYIDKDAATISVPANLSENQKTEAMDLCKKIYMVLGLYGMSRIDLFLEKQTGTFYFNEVNTLPGFTNISQYPMLWKHEGYKPNQLLEELISIAFTRYERMGKLQTQLQG